MSTEEVILLFALASLFTMGVFAATKAIQIALATSPKTLACARCHRPWRRGARFCHDCGHRHV